MIHVQWFGCQHQRQSLQISSPHHGIPTVMNTLRKSAGSLDLLLECSSWEGLHDGLCWLCLHLGLDANIILTHAFVAGLFLVLMRQRPGRVKMPVFLTSFVARATRLFKILEQSLVFISFSVAIAFNKTPFVIGLLPLDAFMAFIAFIAFMGAIFLTTKGRQQVRAPC